MRWQDLRMALRRRLADRLHSWAESLRHLDEPGRNRGWPASTSQEEPKEGTATGLASDVSGQTSLEQTRQAGGPPAHWLAVAKGSGPPKHWLELAKQAEEWVGAPGEPGPLQGTPAVGEGSFPTAPSGDRFPLESPKARQPGEPGAAASPEETPPAGSHAPRPQESGTPGVPPHSAIHPSNRRPAERERKAVFRLLPGRSQPGISQAGTTEKFTRKTTHRAAGKSNMDQPPQPVEAVSPPSWQPQPVSHGKTFESSPGGDRPRVDDLPGNNPYQMRHPAPVPRETKPPGFVSADRKQARGSPPRSELAQGEQGNSEPERAAGMYPDPNSFGTHPVLATPELQAPRFPAPVRAPRLERSGNGRGAHRSQALASAEAAALRSPYQEPAHEEVSSDHWLSLPDVPDDPANEAPGSEAWEVELRDWQHLMKLEREQRGQLWNE